MIRIVSCQALCQHSGPYLSFFETLVRAYFGAKEIENPRDRLLTAHSLPSREMDGTVHCFWSTFLTPVLSSRPLRPFDALEARDVILGTFTRWSPSNVMANRHSSARLYAHRIA
jgi:hypothetical protein